MGGVSANPQRRRVRRPRGSERRGVASERGRVVAERRARGRRRGGRAATAESKDPGGAEKRRAAAAVPAWLLAAAVAAAVGAYYILWLARPDKAFVQGPLGYARSVAMQSSMTATFFVSVFLSVALRSSLPWACSLPWFTAFAITLATPDRMPIDFMPTGCPNWAQHAF